MANFRNRNVVEFLRDFNLIDPIVTKKKKDILGKVAWKSIRHIFVYVDKNKLASWKLAFEYVWYGMGQKREKEAGMATTAVSSGFYQPRVVHI